MSLHLLEGDCRDLAPFFGPFDMIFADPPRDNRHPTQKPVDLLEQLIVTSCPPGGLVGDFFAGSGAVGEACRNTGRRYVGFEITPKYAAVALQRLSE